MGVRSLGAVSLGIQGRGHERLSEGAVGDVIQSQLCMTAMPLGGSLCDLTAETALTFPVVGEGC